MDVSKVQLTELTSCNRDYVFHKAKNIYQLLVNLANICSKILLWHPRREKLKEAKWL